MNICTKFEDPPPPRRPKALLVFLIHEYWTVEWTDRLENKMPAAMAAASVVAGK